VTNEFRPSGLNSTFVPVPPLKTTAGLVHHDLVVEGVPQDRQHPSRHGDRHRA
jgi:hypothetical protein